MIDPAYKSIEEREPTPRDISRRQSIEQFWTIAKRLTSSVKSTYQPVLKAIIRVFKSGVCAPTDIILAFDFGEVLTLKIACSLGLAYLKKLCTAEEFGYFLLSPHPQSDAHIQLLRNEPAIDEQEVEIKELYAELSAIDLTLIQNLCGL